MFKRLKVVSGWKSLFLGSLEIAAVPEAVLSNVCLNTHAHRKLWQTCKCEPQHGRSWPRCDPDHNLNHRYDYADMTAVDDIWLIFK